MYVYISVIYNIYTSLYIHMRTSLLGDESAGKAIGRRHDEQEYNNNTIINSYEIVVIVVGSGILNWFISGY